MCMFLLCLTFDLLSSCPLPPPPLQRLTAGRKAHVRTVWCPRDASLWVSGRESGRWPPARALGLPVLPVMRLPGGYIGCKHGQHLLEVRCHLLSP